MRPAFSKKIRRDPELDILRGELLTAQGDLAQA